MSYTCLIVDDEPLARKLLSEYLSKVPYLQLAGTCSNPVEALDALRRQPPDILFLDVQMPELTGIGLLKVLSKKPYVILTTAYSEYALEGYELDVMDYLLKPITFERFLKAVEKAAERLSPAPAAPVESASATSESTPDFVFVKDGTALVKVRLGDILYVEGLKDYVALHLPGGKRIVTLQRLKTLEEQLPAERFARIHNSYIVGLNWLDVVHKDHVEIGKVKLPVSDSYQKSFREKLRGI